ncbi:SusD-like starch-binding protein associating with outer membrane [Chitinophaga polysaccharea]|uniref:SusD-like starch-binding protein associating with outer membrane n=1 Tax=Chitinophaga polysaccharea TaxID=1293035 RepID=A0A561PTL8_9BACT|nr:RagB/SusD family nutrient uptake outer membrane protein [Chitinophaga polysaccharea]TWF41469.1 SusD-like starch-binding protein associating with outer membrane [Chitinophaga polysaccharea]
MKKYRYHISLFTLLLALCACNKQLDLKPENTMVESELLKNEPTTVNYLADTYIRMMNACAGNNYIFGDVTGNVASGFDQNIVNGTIDPSSENYASLWSAPYLAINQANVIITQLPRWAQFDKSRQAVYIAEAKFIRAFCYLTLIQLYGDGALQNKPDNMGVPLRLGAFDGYDGSQDIPRATNKAVYTQILKDLDEAIADLPANRGDALNQASRATKGAANALAARTCLYTRQYDKAAAYAQAAMAGNYYQLQSNFWTLWPDHNKQSTGSYPLSSELLFAFPESYNKSSKYNDNNGIYYASGYTKPLPSFLATYGAGDERNDSLMLYYKAIIRKFTDTNTRDNVPMIRLPEVMLTAAEALAHTQGINGTSINLLNQVYARAYTKNGVPHVYTAADFGTPTDLITRILQERKWELAFEGFARFDAIRNDMAPNPQLPANRYALPVPQHEIDITQGLIKQNPGY